MTRFFNEKRTLEITTVAGCRVSCSYCPQALFAIENRKVTSRRVLTTGSFRRCLETVPITVDIHFSAYAEPFLNPECIEMIRHAFDKGHRIAVFSTLVGMKAEHLSVIGGIRSGLKNFCVHLPDDGTHMKVKVDDDYLRVLTGLYDLSLPNTEWIYFDSIHPEIQPIVRNWDVRRGRMISRASNIRNGHVPEPGYIAGAVVCSKKRLRKNVLLPNGDVALCCNDFGRKHVIGNLMEGRYEDLHNGAAFREILKRMDGNPGSLLCRQCEYARPKLTIAEEFAAVFRKKFRGLVEKSFAVTLK